VGEFAEAARRLKPRYPHVRFALVGAPDPGNPNSMSEQQLKAWHAEGSVEWWGRREDIAGVFRGAHIVCLPTYYGEGVPKVLIEAAACGRAIVATDWPGCREIVRHRESGLLVPPREVESLTTALSQLLDNAELRREMGKRGRELAERQFSEQLVVQSTLALYQKALGS